jgi:hypothetical protein
MITQLMALLDGVVFCDGGPRTRDDHDRDRVVADRSAG